MSRAPRIILVLYLVTVAAACVYVPWTVTQSGVRIAMDYGFLWNSPGGSVGGVDLDRVVLELVAVSALAGAAMVLVGTEKLKEGSA